MSSSDTPEKLEEAGRAMGRKMEIPPEEMSLSELAQRYSQEMSKFRRQQACDDTYCLEIFRRALVEHNQSAWDILSSDFSESVRLWLRRHQYREVALRHKSEQSYIDDTFKRFWQWASNQELPFSSLAGALRTLHLCLNSAIMDTLRAYSRPKEESLPEMGTLNDLHLLIEDSYLEQELWAAIGSILQNGREQRVIYLLYQSGLKPREMRQRCPGEFDNEQEIYRLTRNALDRLKRNATKLRWKLGEE
jgi:hypothetical protein